MNEKIAENHSMPAVLILAEIGPAIARPKIMMPLMKASTSNALTPVADSNDSIRWVVPSSVAAESSMQKPTKRYSGVARLFAAAAALTPISIRSVCGKDWPINR